MERDFGCANFNPNDCVQAIFAKGNDMIARTYQHEHRLQGGLLALCVPHASMPWRRSDVVFPDIFEWLDSRARADANTQS
jgi:hypothetical protein